MLTDHITCPHYRVHHGCSDFSAGNPRLLACECCMKQSTMPLLPFISLFQLGGAGVQHSVLYCTYSTVRYRRARAVCIRCMFCVWESERLCVCVWPSGRSLFSVRMLRPDLAGWRPRRTWREAPMVPVVTVMERAPARPPQPPPLPAPPPHRPPPRKKQPPLMMGAHELGQLMTLTPSMIDEIVSRSSKHRAEVTSNGEASVTLLVEMNCQQGLRTMRHDKLKYDRYFERVQGEIDGLCRYSPSLKLSIIVEQMPPLVTAESRLGAFELYLVSHLSHPPQCIGLFSKLATRRWPNVAVIARRCEQALEHILSHLSDLKITVATLRVGLKVSFIRWRRFINAKVERIRSENLAVAVYLETGVQRLVKHSFRGFISGVENERRRQEQVVLRWRRWVLLEPLMRFRLGVLISRKQRAYLRVAFNDLSRLTTEERITEQSEEYRARLRKGLRLWVEGAFDERRRRSALARALATWSNVISEWIRDVLDRRTTHLKLQGHLLRRAMIWLRRKTASERARARITLRYWRAADVFRGQKVRMELLSAWCLWIEMRDERKETHRKQHASLMHMAAFDGSTKTIEGFLRAGFDVNGRDEDDGSTPLMLACQNGHELVVKLLLAWGAEPNLYMEDGWTAVMLASENDLSALVPKLASAGADLDMTLANGWTALMLASARGYYNTAVALLDAGADVNIYTHDTRESALTAACRYGHTAVAQVLIDRGADVNIETADNRTPRSLAEDYRLHEVAQLRFKAEGTLKQAETSASVAAVRALLSVSTDSHAGYKALREAAKKGEVEMVDALVDAGVNLNDRDDEDEATPLMLASQNGHHQIVVGLLALGAQVDATMKGRRTALELATFEGHSMIVQSLLVGKADVNATVSTGYTPLMLACSRGHKSAAESLLAGRADINAKESDSLETPLTAACRQGHMDVAKMLMDRGADAGAITRGGQTAQQLAAQHEHEVLRLLRRPVERTVASSSSLAKEEPAPGARAAVRAVMAAAGRGGGQQTLRAAAEDGMLPIVQALLKAGISADVPDEEDDSTVLMAACQNGHEQIAALLLDEGGADANAVMKGGWTPLLLACEGGHDRVVRELLARNANVDTRLFNGWTGCMLAAAHGFYEVLVLLLSAEADAEAQDPLSGETALTAACRSGHINIVRALIQKGANIDVKTSNGQSAFDIADERKNDELYALLSSVHAHRNQSHKVVTINEPTGWDEVAPKRQHHRNPDAEAVAALMEDVSQKKGSRGWSLLRSRRPVSERAGPTASSGVGDVQRKIKARDVPAEDPPEEDLKALPRWGAHREEEASDEAKPAKGWSLLRRATTRKDEHVDDHETASASLPVTSRIKPVGAPAAQVYRPTMAPREEDFEGPRWGAHREEQSNEARPAKGGAWSLLRRATTRKEEKMDDDEDVGPRWQSKYSKTGGSR